MRRYSRLESVEEKRNFRNAILFVVLTIIAIVALFWEGVPLLARFTTFVSDFGKSNKPIVSTDKTPPAPPSFNTFPDFTNQNNITLTGNSESGATIKLTFNGSDQNSLADKDGNFTFNLQLQDGDNTFSAIAVDTANNVSQRTHDYKIVFDSKPPDLTITSPNDGSQFFGSNQRQVTIQGATDSGAQVTVNDRIVTVDDAGKFAYTTTLNDGENKFAVKSTDQAGNNTEKDITLSFSS